MKISTIVSLCLLSLPQILYASPYEVLVVDIAGADDRGKIEEFETAAAKFNALQHKGYFTAKPYFNVIRMATGQVFFLFGYKGEVQGIHRENYPGTLKNLRRLKKDGALRYPNMRWLPVNEIRRLMAAP